MLMLSSDITGRHIIGLGRVTVTSWPIYKSAPSSDIITRPNTKAEMT